MTPDHLTIHASFDNPKRNCPLQDIELHLQDMRCIASANKNKKASVYQFAMKHTFALSNRINQLSIAIQFVALSMNKFTKYVAVPVGKTHIVPMSLNSKGPLFPLPNLLVGFSLFFPKQPNVAAQKQEPLPRRFFGMSGF